MFDNIEIDSQSVTEFLTIKLFENTYCPLKLMNNFKNIK